MKIGHLVLIAVSAVGLLAAALQAAVEPPERLGADHRGRPVVIVALPDDHPVGHPSVCRPQMGHCILFRSSPDRGGSWHRSMVMPRRQCPRVRPAGPHGGRTTRCWRSRRPGGGDVRLQAGIPPRHVRAVSDSSHARRVSSAASLCANTPRAQNGTWLMPYTALRMRPPARR
jgi:hypothetical protein